MAGKRNKTDDTRTDSSAPRGLAPWFHRDGRPDPSGRGREFLRATLPRLRAESAVNARCFARDKGAMMPIFWNWQLVEVDWLNGVPAFTTTRFGLGRVTQ